ncbi:porin [Ferrovibrio terrae]|uniref:porin n=1 Tax=Ferrovibrio terrae TaxID=2594003 RepID=UPI003137B353
MKKTLLLQTALVAAAGLFVADVASAQVKAEPISVSLGGFMEQNFKIQDKGTNANTSQQAESDMTFGRPNTEIWFNIRAVLDNGLKVGGRVELEGATYGDQIDESYAWFENDSYGRIEVGSTDRVSSKMNYFAPAAIPGIGTTAPAEASAARISPLMWYRNSGNDVQGINVYTASNRYFGSKVGKGLMLGVSYVPDGCEDDSVLGTVSSNSDTTTGALSNALTSCGQGAGTSPFGTKTSGNLKDMLQFAGNYLESFGAFDVALFASYNRTNVEQRATSASGTNGNSFLKGANGLTGYALGTTITYNVGDGSTLQVGGGYRNEEVFAVRAPGATVNTILGKESAYTAGIKYLTNGAAAGSIGIGADWWTGSNVVGAGASNVAGSDMDYYGLGLTYQLAAGILLYVGAGIVDYTDQVKTTSTGDYKQTFGQTGFVFNF